MANLLVLPVLLTQKMKNTFNHLLIFLTMFDNIYVMCSILECIRNYFISTPEQIVIMIYIYYNHSSKEQWIILLVHWADSHLQKMSLYAAWTGQAGP